MVWVQVRYQQLLLDTRNLEKKIKSLEKDVVQSASQVRGCLQTNKVHATNNEQPMALVTIEECTVSPNHYFN